jgi:hypothetical protein
MTVKDSIVQQNSGDFDIMIEFKNTIHGMSAIFEQDGRVAYAYLLEQEEFISDVWLYNVDYTPQKPEWKDRLCEMPFRNSIQYVSSPVFKPVIDSNEVHVNWIENNDGNIILNIFVRGELMGILHKGCKPGWSKIASLDSPIAKAIKVASS